MDISLFITEVTHIHSRGNATEHSYRPALQTLLNSVADDIFAVNEPRRVSVGQPDFVVMQNDIPLGYLEAKDIDIGLTGMKGREKDQQERYKGAFPNLIYTNCLEWDFYREGERVASIKIADFMMGIQPIEENFQQLETMLQDYVQQRPQMISSPDDLAERMAGKAKLVKDVFANTLEQDRGQTSELMEQYLSFQKQLIHDISIEDFADVYAETIAYGMFAARLHDETLSDFSRQEALELLPKSNPFLRKLFEFVAGINLDKRISWVLDDLAYIFQASDVKKLMEGFGVLTGQNDPFLHFYETFLAAYNPEKRKSRGVWYTPEPVVNFIVRAVDDVLKYEFGLGDGLADTSKITVDWDTGQRKMNKDGTLRKDGRNQIIKKDVHRVQILDPATGTGTFLAEVIKQIAPKVKDVAPSLWNRYIHEDLIPRLHGFELLMASYAMCHLKLDMVLTELGYQPDRDNPERLSVYLTNSLEEGAKTTQSLPFARWLAEEARGANEIKNDKPIMCIIGNPPYLGEGGIASDPWMRALMEDYKKEPGGQVKLNERNPKLLNDLYVKFIRMSSHLIEKNGEGILGFITNHGYLDNPTFRGMRWHLLTTFDEIYVLDLHGNAKKKEITPEGKPDKNVFDIQQGVAIIIAVKTKNKKQELAIVKHGDLWGKREEKYKALKTKTWDAFHNGVVTPQEPFWLFAKRDYSRKKDYEKGFSVVDLMPINSTGIKTHRDHFAFDFDRARSICKLNDLKNPSISNAMISERYDVKDNGTWTIDKARCFANNLKEEDIIQKCVYRPFDERWCLFGDITMDRPRTEIMRHMIEGENIGLIFSRQAISGDGDLINIFASKHIVDNRIVFSNKGTSQAAPLYLYPTETDLDQSRRVNFEPKLHKKIIKAVTHPDHGAPDEVKIFDYIYGVLHCPLYRETYAEFLKIDFPRIPWPSSPDEFWDISAKGGQLRILHLMDDQAIGQTPFPLLGEGDSIVEKPEFKQGQVWINGGQYFDNVPEIAWNFYIGGYQPTQKWLKDRKGRALSFEDIKHYQKIIKILIETDRIMKSITMKLD